MVNLAYDSEMAQWAYLWKYVDEICKPWTLVRIMLPTFQH